MGISVDGAYPLVPPGWLPAGVQELGGAGETTPSLMPSMVGLWRGLADRSVRLEVRGLPFQCWKCGAEQVIPIFVEVPAMAEVIGVPSAGFLTASGICLEYAAELLRNTGHSDLAVAVKVRRSVTAREAYVSNGCTQCDVLFGRFQFEGESIGVDMESLPILVSADRPLLELVMLVSNEGRSLM